MHASKMTMSLALLILSFTTSVFSVPLPQGAGVGAGCDAILTDADTGSGLAVKEAGQNAASLIKSTGLRVRQGAGVGAACNSILTDADTSSGMAVKIAGNNIASNLRNAEGKVGLKSRQLDKVGAGVAAVVGALPGCGAPAGIITSSTGSIDGAGTSGSAAIGEQIGEYELEIGYGIGNAVPSALISKVKRQLDKVGAGVAAIAAAVPGGGEAANIIAGSTGSIDGAGTSGSAELGQQIGDAEVQIGTGAGNLVPSKVPTIPGAPGLPKLPL